MKLTRRAFTLSTAKAAAFAGVASSGLALDADSPLPLTVIWDSRIEGLSSALPSASRLIDLATLDDAQWFALAREIDVSWPVAGFTDWSSYIVLRDALREQGLRLQQREQRLDQGTGRTLFVWQMG